MGVSLVRTQTKMLKLYFSNDTPLNKTSYYSVLNKYEECSSPSHNSGDFSFILQLRRLDVDQTKLNTS